MCLRQRDCLHAQRGTDNDAATQNLVRESEKVRKVNLKEQSAPNSALL